MTARLWDRREPNRCSCTTAYRPVLNARGTLVKAREPAWRMKEQTRDPGCLQEIMRAMSGAYRARYQHHRRSDGSGAGYPDCHLWAPLRQYDPNGAWFGGSRYAELKRMGHDPTPVQCEVMATLQDATPGGHVYLVRPCCVFTGAVDAMLAELTGRANLDVRGGRAFPPVEIPADAPLQPAVPVPAPTRVAYRPADGPVVRAPEPPGADPVGFAPAVGYVIPTPVDGLVHAAAIQVEGWLREHGFAPTVVPYPMRLIVGVDQLHVYCRIGRARPGAYQHQWRGAMLRSPFPERLIPVLNLDLIAGPSSAAVATLIEQVRPSAVLTP